MKCVKIPSDKKSYLSARKGVESVTITSDKVIKRNDDSCLRFREGPLDHSTPVVEKRDANTVEDSPELDYCASPLLPYTQEGGNEVAWDWHNSLSKTPESKKKQKVQCETPKGTKLLARKRNSNSPLLYKPLKRKTIKQKNMENIGQFTAELQALSEKMKIIQSDKTQSNNRAEEGTSVLANASNKEEAPRIKNDERNCVAETDSHGRTVKNNVNNASGNYDDLFDDSADESMIRCTQEMEEKFNLNPDNENSALSQVNIKKEESPHANVKEEELPRSNVKKEELPRANVKKEELSHTSETTVKTSKGDRKAQVQFTANASSKESLTKTILHESRDNNNTLKTYSRLSLKRDANSSIVATQRNEDLHQSRLNNNNMTSAHVKRSCDNRWWSRNESADLFNFPDDSFDDCLATCVEDELSAFDDSLARKAKHDGTKLQATSCNRLTRAPLKSEAKPVSPLKTATKVEASSSVSFENRKFFKTKSLSDQFMCQDVKGATSASSYATRSSASRPSATAKSTPQASVARAPVSTNPIVTSKVAAGVNPLMHGMDRTRVHDVGRCAARDGADRFVRHHSTGNMTSDAKETTKTGSQPTRCTAEEIEKKRLQALMRLQTRRKLNAMTVTNNINR